MKNIYLLALFLVAGCSSSPMPKLTHSDNNANYDKDYYECSNEAERLLSSYGSAFDNMMRPSRLTEKTVSCMKAKGWHETNKNN